MMGSTAVDQGKITIMMMLKNALPILLIGLAIAQARAEDVVSVDASGFVPFNHLDSDRNGYVSRVEARSVTGVEKAFDSVDSNRDGLLDHEEFRLVRTAREAE